MGRNRSSEPVIVLQLEESEVSDVVMALGLMFTDPHFADRRDELRQTLQYTENKLQRWRYTHRKTTT